jgi:ankyrin repeat protein
MTNVAEHDYKLHKYAIEGKKNKLNAILNRGSQSVDALDLNGNTALYYACLKRNKTCIKALLDHNANVNG